MGASQASSEGAVMVDVASGGIGVDAAVDLARRALLATGSSTELRGEMTDLAGDHVAWVLVGEKYFLRNSSYASLTVLVSGDARASRVQALASVIIGLAVFSGLRFMKGTTSVIFGAIFYSLCLNYLVLVDTDGIYLKLWNAVMFMLILIFNEKISGFLTRRSHTEKNGGLPHA